MLFLHGAGSTRMWLPMYERFSQSVDFIAPEHPGFGETERPDWLQNFNDLVIHYDQLLAELDIGRFHLVATLQPYPGTPSAETRVSDPGGQG